MLIATLRDKGRCPCPRCLVVFPDINKIGTSEDSDSRHRNARDTVEVQSDLVQQARGIIYDDGYVVNSDRVETLLREHSLVPTVVCSVHREGPTELTTAPASFRMPSRVSASSTSTSKMHSSWTSFTSMS